MLYFPVNILSLLISMKTSHPVMITINKVSGQDNTSCINNPPSHPCQTLDYVVSNIKITNNVSIYFHNKEWI